MKENVTNRKISSMRWLLLIVCCVGMVLVTLLVVQPTEEDGALAVDVTIDYSSVVSQSPEGYGYEYGWIDQDDSLYEQRYKESNPTIIRIQMPHGMFEPTNDNGDPNNSVINFNVDLPIDVQKGKTINLQKMLESLKDLLPDAQFQINIWECANWLATEPDTFEVFPSGAYPPTDYDEYREWLRAIADWLVNDIGISPDRISFTFVNEPNSQPGWATHAFVGNVQDLVTMASEARLALDEVSPDIKLGGVEEAMSSTWTTDFINAGGDKYVDFYTFHVYKDGRTSLANTIQSIASTLQTYGKPVYLTEYGDSNYGDPGGTIDYSSQQAGVDLSYVNSRIWKMGLDRIVFFRFSNTYLYNPLLGADRWTGSGLFADHRGTKSNGVPYERFPAYWVFANFYTHMRGADVIASTATGNLEVISGKRVNQSGKYEVIVWITNTGTTAYNTVNFQVLNFPATDAIVSVYDNLQGNACTDSFAISGMPLDFTYTIPARSSYCFVLTSAEDLRVTEITLNYDAPSLDGIAVGPEQGPDVYTECNNISTVIEEGSGVDVLSPFDVTFEENGAQLCPPVRVPGLTGGSTKTVYCNCSWYPQAGDDFAINVTVDSNNEISESNETNNTMWNNGTAVSNGYKGDGWQGPEMNLTNVQCHDQDTINLIYSVGDSYYLSGSTHWTEYLANWTTSDLPVPKAATIETALLYVYYTLDKDNVMPGNVNLKFNGNSVSLARDYSDRKGFGDHDYPAGMLVYIVTDHFTAAGNNNVVLTKSNSALEVSMKGMLLMVVYKHPDEPERIICIDEGFDILYAEESYAVSSEEATTYASFECCDPIPLKEIGKATLIAVAPNAADGDDWNRLSFNEGLWKGIWDHYEAATELGIAKADVLAYLEATDNRAHFQSHIPAGETEGDFMEASNAFLILEKTRGPCPAKNAVYQAAVPDPEGILNPIRALRDDNLKVEYVDRYYDNSPALTMVIRRNPALAHEAARILAKYSPMVSDHVNGISVDKPITGGDMGELVSFTNRLKRGVLENRGEIGAERRQELIKFLDGFKEQVVASKGKTFSQALRGSIYYEGELMPIR